MTHAAVTPSGDASAGLEQQESGNVHGRGRLTAGDFKHGEEEHRADAVVEERFAGQLGLNRFGNANPAKHFEHRNGIGGRDEGAEDEALHPRDAHAGKEFHESGDEKDERTVPTIESSETVSFSRPVGRGRAGRLRQKAAAAACRAGSALWKSMWLDKIQSPLVELRSNLVCAVSAIEASTVRSMVPMVMGSLSQRVLIMPKSGSGGEQDAEDFEGGHG